MAQDGAPPPGEGWDAALLDAWRSEAGYGGVYFLELLPGKPKLGFNLSGVVQLMLEGRIGNPLIRRGLDLMGEEQDIIQQAADPETAAAAADRRIVLHQATLDWHDALIAAVWVSPPNPPWCRLADVPSSGRPPGQFCIHDIPVARRGMLTALLIDGAEGLQSFREQSAVLAAAQDGGSLRPAAKQLPDPDPTPAPAVLVRPGDLAGGQPGGPEGAGAPSGLYAIPWEPDADGGADPLGA